MNIENNVRAIGVIETQRVYQVHELSFRGRINYATFGHRSKRHPGPSRRIAGQRRRKRAVTRYPSGPGAITPDCEPWQDIRQPAPPATSGRCWD